MKIIPTLSRALLVAALANCMSISWGAEPIVEKKICLMYCPKIAACKLSFSIQDGTCSCRCTAFPDETKDIFKKAGLLDGGHVFQLQTDKEGMTTYSPSTRAPAGGFRDLNLKPFNARETSPHPEARERESPKEFHERQGREQAVKAAGSAANEMRRELGNRGR